MVGRWRCGDDDGETDDTVTVTCWLKGSGSSGVEHRAPAIHPPRTRARTVVCLA